MNPLGNNDAFVLDLSAFVCEDDCIQGIQTGNQVTQEALLTEDLHPALFQNGLLEPGTIDSLSIQGQGGGHSAPRQQQQQGTATATATGDSNRLRFSNSNRAQQSGLVGAEAAPPGHTNQQPRQNGGMLGYIIEHIFGPNESNPVWWLILIASFSFVAAAMVGVLFLPGSLEEIRTTYWRVLLIMTVGVPMVVAVITVLVSFWLASDAEGRTNWITGLSVANVSMLAGPLFFYWMLTRN